MKWNVVKLKTYVKSCRAPGATASRSAPSLGRCPRGKPWGTPESSEKKFNSGETQIPKTRQAIIWNRHRIALSSTTPNTMTLLLKNSTEAWMNGLACGQDGRLDYILIQFSFKSNSTGTVIMSILWLQKMRLGIPLYSPTHTVKVQECLGDSAC